MPTNRTRLNRRRRPQVTGEVLSLFRRLVEIQQAGRDDTWEPQGHRREYLDGQAELHRLLGLPPWHTSPLDTLAGEPKPDWLLADMSAGAATWDDAAAIRAELEEAAKA